MRLNLGCGFDKRDGFVNVDTFSECDPDMIADLNTLPWPWDDDSVDEILLRHVLEHLGAEVPVFLGIMKEIWRICRHGAVITITVPHPRHDHFLNDPTHVRAITPQGLEMFSLKKNREWAKSGLANTPLAIQTGTDFDILDVQMTPDEPWRSQYAAGKLSAKELNQAMRMHNNVISEMTIRLKAIKEH